MDENDLDDSNDLNDSDNLKDIKGNVTTTELINDIEISDDRVTVFVQLKASDVPKYRKKILKEQEGLCAICKTCLKNCKGVSLDHQHKTKAEKIGVNGAGLVRGVLCRDCNVFEGKIWNNSKRYGKFDNLPEFLRNLADYLEKENYPYIHPKEKPPIQKVSKRQYNKLVKAYKEQNTLKAKLPEFPGKRKPSKKLLSLFERFKISPYL